MRKKLNIILSLALIIGLLAGCSTGTGSASVKSPTGEVSYSYKGTSNEGWKVTLNNVSFEIPSETDVKFSNLINPYGISMARVEKNGEELGFIADGSYVYADESKESDDRVAAAEKILQETLGVSIPGTLSEGSFMIIGSLAVTNVSFPDCTATLLFRDTDYVLIVRNQTDVDGKIGMITQNIIKTFGGEEEYAIIYGT